MSWHIRAFYLNPDELEAQNPGFSTLLKDQGHLMTRGVLALAPCLNVRGSSSPIYRIQVTQDDLNAIVVKSDELAATIWEYLHHSIRVSLIADVNRSSRV